MQNPLQDHRRKKKLMSSGDILGRDIFWGVIFKYVLIEN